MRAYVCVRQRQSTKYTVNNIRVYIDYQSIFYNYCATHSRTKCWRYQAFNIYKHVFLALSAINGINVVMCKITYIRMKRIKTCKILNLSNCKDKLYNNEG